MKNLGDIFKGKDTYVICSTLNQIVNYIPIKLMEKKFKDKSIKIFNITVEGESEGNSIFKRFDNSAWDKNLENILEEDGIEICDKKNSYDKINIKRNDCNDIFKKLQDKFKSTKDGECDINCNVKNCKKEEVSGRVWNITGGQRSTIFTIQKFIAHEKNDKDCIIYLEGNSNDIVCMKYNNESKEFDCELLEEKYNIDLDLNTVFKLAGFEISSDKKNMINYLKPLEKYKSNNKFKSEIEEYELCEKFYRFYEKSNEEDRKKFLNILINLNKNSKSEEEKKYEKPLAKEKNKDEKAKKDNAIKINNFIENFKEKFHIDGEVFDKEYLNAEDILIRMKGNSQKKFGYILEYMAIACIVETIKIELSKYIVGVYHSVKLDRADDKLKYSNTTELCEFDIVLLTKSGQVVIFECKSGTMSSDVGKARQYTAYAAGGVYGKPVLITPLLKKDMETLGDKKCEEYDSIYKALYAAARGNMEVWGLDEIGEKLYELYKEVLGVEAKNE